MKILKRQTDIRYVCKMSLTEYAAIYGEFRKNNPIHAPGVVGKVKKIELLDIDSKEKVLVVIESSEIKDFQTV